MANKWADYLVSAVRYEDKASKDRISNLKVHNDNGDTVGSGSDWTRQKAIDNIENNNSFCTIYKKSSGEWTKGAEVHVVNVEGSKYLRTDANKTKKDNLGELPEF